MYCSSLTNVVIPEGVTNIGSDTFYECRSLTSVVIPASVTSIGVSAFWGCPNLTSITYNGTKAQWAAITKGSSWNYNVPTTTKVQCTDGETTM